MKRTSNKSDCPVNFTVEIFGDTWSFLIVRDIVAVGKKTFNEFLASDERIGPSLLAERLSHLEQEGILTKSPDKVDKRKVIYSLTEAGLNLIPIIYEIARWGSLMNLQASGSNPWSVLLQHDKEMVLRLWREAVASGSSFFAGPNSVADKLGLGSSK